MQNQIPTFTHWSALAAQMAQGLEAAFDGQALLDGAAYSCGLLADPKALRSSVILLVSDPREDFPVHGMCCIYGCDRKVPFLRD
jgi:hypothetical protein